MKKVIMCTVILSLIYVPFVYAEKDSIDKLQRGVVNVLTAPIEIPRQTRAYWIEGAQLTDHILVWVFSGAVYGVVQTVKRAGSGVWDIISFPFDRPQGYEPLLKPDYVFENWPRDPDIFIFKKK